MKRWVDDRRGSHRPDLLIRYGDEVVAMATEHQVLLAPSISVLEHDHPRRRFVAAMVLVGREMTTEPGGEPYHDDQAAFYARILLMPNDALARVGMAESRCRTPRTSRSRRCRTVSGCRRRSSAGQLHA